MLSYLLIASLGIMITSLVGVFTLWKKAGTIIEKNISYLVSFSAGIFFIVALSLSKETIEISTWWPGLSYIFIGASFIWFIFKLVPTFHHHHDEDLETDHHNVLDGRRILAGDAIHNIGDGILLASAFSVSLELGLITAFGIFVHEFVQETSEFFVLKQAGFSSVQALVANFSVSATILIGALGGYFALESVEKIEGPLLGIAAGSFFIVVFYDLIPQSVRASRARNKYLGHIVLFLAGLTIMTSLNSIVGETHIHGDDDHEEEIHEETHVE